MLSNTIICLSEKMQITKYYVILHIMSQTNTRINSGWERQRKTLGSFRYQGL